MALIGPGGHPVTPTQNAATGTSPHVKDSGLATFAADVLEASRAERIKAVLASDPRHSAKAAMALQTDLYSRAAARISAPSSPPVAVKAASASGARPR